MKIIKYLFMAVMFFVFSFAAESVLLAQQTQNKIFACYQRSNGQLRRVSALSECRAAEESLSWDTNGVTGPQGPKGDKGDKGEQGEKGEKGEPGTIDTSNIYTKTESDERFLRGNGTLSGGAADVPNFGQVTLLLIPGEVHVRGYCSSAIQSDLNVSVFNGSWNMFLNSAKVKIFARNITTGYGIGNTDNANGDRFFLQLTKNGGGPSITIEGSTAFGNPCYYQWTSTVVNQ
jgi:hypothetical protein